ncbi:MAG TPA: hypothetical protein VIX86_06200 [Streptosporangiaceae bacterium]
MITIGDSSYETEEVRAALGILIDAPGVMVRQPLARAGNALSGMDYHAIARSELLAYPELRMAPGSHSEPTPHVKTAVIHYLERVLTEAAASRTL